MDRLSYYAKSHRYLIGSPISASHRMKITDFAPSQRLQPFIKRYRIVEGQDELTNRVLPNTSLAMAIRLGGQVSYAAGTEAGKLPAFTLSGLRKSVRLINYSNATSTLVVLFQEGGAAAFLKEPLHELFERTLPLESLVPSCELILLEEQLSEVPDQNRKALIVDQFFLNKLRETKVDRLVQAAVRKIKSTNGAIRINELADMLSVSNDAFEKRFRKVVGASPKQFASIIRMSSVIEQLKQKPDFLTLAIDAGFYDQSHFIKTFRTFTGLTPTEFSRSASHW